MFNPLISINEFTEIISSYLVKSWVMKKQDIGWESLDWKPREKVGKRSEEIECMLRPCPRTAGLSGAAHRW